MKRVYLLFIFLVLEFCGIVTTNVQGQEAPAFYIDNLENQAIITSNVSHWKDTGVYGASKPIEIPKNANFKGLETEHIYYSYENCVHWFKVKLNNNLPKRKNYYLELANPLLHDVQALEKGQGKKPRLSGTRYSFDEKDIYYRNIIFEVWLEPGEMKELYIRVDNNGNYLSFPFKIWDSKEFVKQNYRVQFYISAYYGIILLILVVNLYLFVVTKRKILLFYLLYGLSMAAMQFIRDGHVMLWVDSDWSLFNAQLSQLFIFLSVGFNIIFFQHFLDSKKHTPKYHTFLNVIKVIAFVSLPLPFFTFGMEFLYLHIKEFVILGNCSVIVGALLLIPKKRQEAIYFSIGFGSLFIGVLIIVGVTVGIIQSTFLADYALKIATLVEIIILTIAMVAYVRKRQKKAQQLALEQLELTRRLELAQKEKELSSAALSGKLATMELKALQSQMNSHFIFNALNSIQGFIAKEEGRMAEKYLAQFARLIRKFLDHSKLPKVTVGEEMELLKRYLEMEKLRFKEQLNFSITASDAIDIEDMFIVPMMIQPFVENAIIHGILPKQEKGNVNIQFSIGNPGHLLCEVADDGVGRNHLRKELAHRSWGTQITQERLQAFQEVYHSEFGVEIEDILDAEGVPVGTKVKLNIPLLNAE